MLSLVFEKDLSFGRFLAVKASLMHQVMMMSAEQYQVVHIGLTAIRPVGDVVGIDKATAGTTRKAATAIATLQGSANGRGNAAGLAPDA